LSIVLGKPQQTAETSLLLAVDGPGPARAENFLHLVRRRDIATVRNPDLVE
jgi:hypothetical protein